MEPVEFKIKIKSPIGLSIDLQKDIFCPIVPKYRLLGIELVRINGNLFDLTAYFHPKDINIQTELNELFLIRDKLLSLLSIIMMVPVNIYHKGVFTFPLGGRKYKALSLGPTDLEAAPVSLHSLNPLVEGLSLPPKYSSAVYYIWQAINADEPLFRFINTAICVELLAGADSPSEKSISPKCTSCSYLLEKCPQCNKSWGKISNSLKNKITFLITDKNILNRFVDLRNRVFHGNRYIHEPSFTNDLSEISVQVLLAVRNYIGKIIGLDFIEEKDLSLIFFNTDITVGVYYTTPDPESN
jgi:hypothetical protein